MKNSCQLLNIFVSWQELTLTTIGTGDANSFRFGREVALSGDANTMAVGGHFADLRGATDAGLVRLYRRDGTDWNMFQQINGPAVQGGYFGYTLDLSHDSSTLAVGAAFNSVYIYDYNNVTSVYDWFHTTANFYIWEVRVSGDGSTFGVTSRDSVGARIFVRDAHGFQQRGDTITSYGSYDSGIALSYDGKIAAIGQRNWSSWTGRVGVFQWRDANGNGSLL